MVVTPSLILYEKPQAYTEFQPLKEVLVGRCYDNNFIDLRYAFYKTNKKSDDSSYR